MSAPTKSTTRIGRPRTHPSRLRSIQQQLRLTKAESTELAQLAEWLEREPADAIRWTLRQEHRRQAKKHT